MVLCRFCWQAATPWSFKALLKVIAYPAPLSRTVRCLVLGARCGSGCMKCDRNLVLRYFFKSLFVAAPQQIFMILICKENVILCTCAKIFYFSSVACSKFWTSVIKLTFIKLIIKYGISCLCVVLYFIVFRFKWIWTHSACISCFTQSFYFCICFIGIGGAS